MSMNILYAFVELVRSRSDMFNALGDKESVTKTNEIKLTLPFILCWEELDDDFYDRLDLNNAFSELIDDGTCSALIAHENTVPMNVTRVKKGLDVYRDAVARYAYPVFVTGRDENLVNELMATTFESHFMRKEEQWYIRLDNKSGRSTFNVLSQAKSTLDALSQYDCQVVSIRATEGSSDFHYLGALYTLYSTLPDILHTEVNAIRILHDIDPALHDIYFKFCNTPLLRTFNEEHRDYGIPKHFIEDEDRPTADGTLTVLLKHPHFEASTELTYGQFLRTHKLKQ